MRQWSKLTAHISNQLKRVKVDVILSATQTHIIEKHNALLFFPSRASHSTAIQILEMKCME